MAVSAQFLQFTLDQLSAIMPVRHRRMFGGVGFYAGELFFALAAEDTLYFKVDAESRPAFEREHMQPFQPFGPDQPVMGGYFTLPARLYEDEEELARWMRTAVAVAARAALRKPARKPPSRRRKS
jgi:DNA transformation protein and related proteins